MRLSDHLRPRTAEEVRRDILTQIKAESERSGIAMNSEWASDKAEAGDKAGQGRAITRGEEARVRAAVERALTIHPSAVYLIFGEERLADIRVAYQGKVGRVSESGASLEALARAGIVPGADGWCWAPSAVSAGDTFRSKKSGKTWTVERYLVTDALWAIRCPDGGTLYEPERDLLDPAQWTRAAVEAPPPAWLTAAVLAALPVDGTPCSLLGLAPRITKPADARGEGVEETRAVLAALVATSEIESVEGGRAWRRWGVPEGWEIRDDHAGWEYIVREGAPLGNQIACVRRDGHWTIFRGEDSCSPLIEGDGGQRAALRACYERGVFAPAAAPKPAPSTPTDPAASRPARLRTALLAVLTRGPILTTSALLPALDAAMGERAGVAVARGGEAQQAAREIGARVDGVEWSLPPIPDGWGWRRVIASRWYLAPLDASDPERERVAEMGADDGVGGIGGLMWCVKGAVWQACASVEEGQAAALQAARLAGLFAAPRASTVAVDDTAPKGSPVVLTAQNGEEAVRAPAPVPAPCQCSACRLPAIEHALALATAEIDRQRARADAADPLHRAALAVSTARQRLSAAGPGTDEWSAAEIEVARTTGALLDLLGVDAEEVAADARHAQRIAENERDAALARSGLDAADRATLDAVGRLREALTALCAGPGAWQWKVDESAPDAAARLIGVMASRIADFETVQRVADAHRQEMRASRDAALAELTRVRDGIAAVMGAIAGGREVGK